MVVVIFFLEPFPVVFFDTPPDGLLVQVIEKISNSAGTEQIYIYWPLPSPFVAARRKLSISHRGEFP